MPSDRGQASNRQRGKAPRPGFKSEEGPKAQPAPSRQRSASDSAGGGRPERSGEAHRAGGRRSRGRRGGRDRDGGFRGVYSAIDLGTNNCRLLIAKPTRHGFRVVDAFSRIVRLGEGIKASGDLSEAAMDRTVDALKICAQKIDRRGVTCMRHVATEACRVAGNRDVFVDRIKQETGLNIEVISAAEEARLAVMGCQSLVAPTNRHALVFDIGGGSTELIWVRMKPGGGSEIQGWMSIPWGVVNLTEQFGDARGNASANAYAAMIDEVKTHLNAFEEAHNVGACIGRRRVQFLGTSGTVTTLASLHLKLPRYIRDEVDGAWMKAHHIQRLSHQVAEMSYDERAAQPCIGRERADLVVAGCAILEGILGMWQVPSLRVADRGIREGILRGLMQLDSPPANTMPGITRPPVAREQTAFATDRVGADPQGRDIT
ncbi:Ppx/GppA phosphatase family protein [Yunchengibacter salinarum]|uniref:Ppx/GppA phosphatase family protein n=1 Tax=Yunchengibacter salinarum TaxID=3133399 RepID=UPI0035B635AA